MSPDSRTSDFDCVSRQHLVNLRALLKQLRETTSALATKEAPQLVESFSLLELGCARLQQSLQKITPAARSSDLPLGTTTGLAEQIHTAHLELARLNYRFSALLRRRWRSVEILLRHYQSISRELGPDSEHPPAMRRISAEV